MKEKVVNDTEYNRYILSRDWREKANQRLAIDHRICCVCGKKATEVHHLTYEHFENEPMDDIISLCHDCHMKAEEIYDPIITPRAMDEVKPEGNNFMAAMRVDAQNISMIVFDYLTRKCGSDFDSLMRFRQPAQKGDKNYWSVLKQAIKALCYKRYYYTLVADRREMMLTTITNHTITIFLDKIEHSVRNNIQATLFDDVWGLYDEFGKWNKVAEETGLSNGTISKIKNDDGTSFGPSLREEVLYYCGLDAAAGIRPIKGFSCLSEDDYKMLNETADYMTEVSGEGAFKGEYKNKN